MDRALKERIIGAVVLVAIIVLVVPVFLDGPAPEPGMISEPVLLPGQSREPGARKTVVLERDRDQPLPDAPAREPAHPVEAAAERDAPASKPQAEPVEQAAAPPAEEPDTSGRAAVAENEKPAPPRDDEPPATSEDPKPAAESATESATGMWAVQLGSFSNKANADRLAASLREEGYAAFLSQHRSASGELHRVRIGPQKDRASAEAVAARLDAEGLKGQVVPHP